MESVKYNILVPSFLLNNDVFFFFIRPSLININWAVSIYQAPSKLVGISTWKNKDITLKELTFWLEEENNMNEKIYSMPGSNKYY